jgi:hypothetical protein
LTTIFTTVTAVTEFKNVSHQWKALGYPSADALMPPVLELLNGFPGLATRWCCQGHRPFDDFYIMFGATAEGYAILVELYLRLKERLAGLEDFFPRGNTPGMVYKNDLELKMTTRLNNPSSDLPDRAFNVFILAVNNVADEVSRVNLVNHLLAALQEMNPNATVVPAPARLPKHQRQSVGRKIKTFFSKR